MKHLILPEGWEEKPLVFYLAMEEFAANSLDEDAFFLWQVSPTVIFGRNQVMEAEVDTDYCTTNGISIFRRKSGGGCVYSDMGNIMISCVTSSANVPFLFDSFLTKVVCYLKSLGLPAVRSGRNDILINGKKVSGNAFYKLPRRSIIHGTMLFDTDFEQMAKAITPSLSKIESKGVHSVRQRVANVSEFSTVGIEEFKSGLIRFFCDGEILLTSEQVSEIEDIMTTYTDEKFLYDHQPRYTRTFEGKIDGVGEISLMVDVKDSTVRNVSLNGDFFALCDSPGESLSDCLRGEALSVEAFAAAIPDDLPGELIRNLTKYDILRLIEDN